MEKPKSPWHVTEGEGKKLDDLRQKNEFVLQTFYELKSQIDKYIEQKNMDAVSVLASPEQNEMDVITSTDEDLNQLTAFINDTTGHINDIFSTREIDSLCIVNLKNNYIKINFK